MFSFVSSHSSLRRKKKYLYIYTLLKEKVQKCNSIYFDFRDGEFSKTWIFLHLVKCKLFVNCASGGQVTPLYTILKFFAINFHIIIIFFLWLSKYYDKITLHTLLVHFLIIDNIIRHLIVNVYIFIIVVYGLWIVNQ